MPSDAVITGVGIVSPLGVGAQETAAAWQSGRQADRRTLPELSGTAIQGLEVAVLPEFDMEAAVGGRRNLRYMSPAAALAYMAAQEAMTDAGARGRIPAEDLGLYAATGPASADYDEIAPIVQQSIDDEGQFSCALFGRRGLSITNPLLSFRMLGNMPACLIAILEDIRGPNLVFTPWEDQTCAAMVEAWRDVAAGQATGILTGASAWAESAIALTTLRKSRRVKGTSFMASAAAYLFIERADTLPPGRRAYARIRRMTLAPSNGRPLDPLAERIGKAVTASPALLLAMAALLGWPRVEFDDGSDARLVVELEPRS